ncbi:MAG TPA: aminoglycoside phosphotransferase family protein [Segeticoccus sp.]|jgi:aminoglycoside phosphotransferase (APT) family kinase protein|nr:aminoglycoside phosphotransferase family protein [Segeticoccus sp.]
MPRTRLHADEVAIDDALARRLLAAQLPDVADLPLTRLASGGTENAVFRLGDQLALRMPLQPSAVDGLLKEVRWMPVVARHLSVETPTVVALGDSSADYPFPWAVVRWLEGSDGLRTPLHRLPGAASDVTRLVGELQAVDTSGAPAPGSKGFGRGLPLVGRDADVRAGLDRCAARNLTDVDRLTTVWEEALAAPPWQDAPVWLHADLIPGNVLVRDGRLAGLLDFGAMATGDPAYDITAAWHLLDAADRETFLTALDVDEATRRRARGLVVGHAVVALPYYLDTHPAMVGTARRGIEQVLSDPD